MGYFAYQVLILPREGTPILVTRAMEHATVKDQVPDLEHFGYADGTAPPPTKSPESDVVFATTADDGRAAGLRPWEMSFGQDAAASAGIAEPHFSAQVRTTIEALATADLLNSRLGLEKSSSFLPFSVAESLIAATPNVHWTDASGLVDESRIVQSPLEPERPPGSVTR